MRVNKIYKLIHAKNYFYLVVGKKAKAFL